MTRSRPPTLKVLGLATLSVGALWLAWLVLGRGADLIDLLAAGLGNRAAVTRLQADHLAAAGTVVITFLTLLLELTLSILLILAGIGLLRLHPAARWAALFCCYAVIPLEGLSTLLQVFFLTPQGAAVKLLPVLVNGLLILFAIACWGGVFLPEVVAAYTGDEGPPADPGQATLPPAV